MWSDRTCWCTSPQERSLSVKGKTIKWKLNTKHQKNLLFLIYSTHIPSHASFNKDCVWKNIRVCNWVGGGKKTHHSTWGHTPPDWALRLISSTVFRRESWSDLDTNTGRMYLIRAEGDNKKGWETHTHENLISETQKPTKNSTATCLHHHPH